MLNPYADTTQEPTPSVLNAETQPVAPVATDVQPQPPMQEDSAAQGQSAEQTAAPPANLHEPAAQDDVGGGGGEVATPSQDAPWATHEDAVKAAKYFQGRATQSQQLLKDVQDNLEIVNWLKSNPQAYQHIIQAVDGGGAQAQQAPQQVAQPVEPPTPPQPPRDYYDEEAVKRYHQRQVDYNRALQEWTQAEITRHTSTLQEQVASQRRQQEQQQQQTQVEVQARQQLQFEGGATPQELDGIIRDLRSHVGYHEDPKLVVQMYRMRNRPSAEEVRKQHALQTAKQRAEGIPQTAAAAAGTTSPPPTGQPQVFRVSPAGFDPYA